MKSMDMESETDHQHSDFSKLTQNQCAEEIHPSCPEGLCNDVSILQFNKENRIKEEVKQLDQLPIQEEVKKLKELDQQRCKQSMIAPENTKNDHEVPSGESDMVLQLKKEVELLKSQMNNMTIFSSHLESQHQTNHKDDSPDSAGDKVYTSSYNINHELNKIVANDRNFIDFKNDKFSVFCIDMSCSMNPYLTLTKNCVETALKFRVAMKNDLYFGLISFNSNVMAFSNELKSCDESNTLEAIKWVGNLEAEKGTNTLGALMKALQYDNCDAIHLLTDGNQDQSPSEILNVLSVMEKKCKIHCYYLYSNSSDHKTIDFLTQLAVQTCGSLKVVNCNQNTYIEKVIPVYSAHLENFHSVQAFPNKAIQSNIGHLNSFNSDNANSKKEKKDPIQHIIQSSPANNGIGKHVLARFLTDGLFYKCTINNQIHDDSVIIKFPNSAPVKENSNLREVKRNDFINYEDALLHSIDVGYKVLAPVSEDPLKFAPATVIDGRESRLPEGKYDDTHGITVHYFTGKSANISTNKAVWISSSLYDKFVFEIQLPHEVRKYFSTKESSFRKDSIESYGATVLEKTSDSVNEQPLDSSSYIMPIPYFNNASIDSKLFENNSTKSIPGTDYTSDQLNERVTSLIMEYKNGSINNHMGTSSLKKSDQFGKLRKSVSFQDLDSGIGSSIHEDSLLDSDNYDSGLDSDSMVVSDTEFDYDKKNAVFKSQNDNSFGTSPKLLRRRRRKSSSQDKPRWSYWKNDPTPKLIESNNYGPYRYGEYEPTATAPVFEVYPAQDEWTSPLSRFVDVEAVSKQTPTIRDCMYVEKREKKTRLKQGKGMEVSLTLGEYQKEKDRMKDAALESKKSQARQRMNSFIKERENQFTREQSKHELKQKKYVGYVHQMYEKENQNFVKAQQLRESKAVIHNELHKGFHLRNQNANEKEKYRLKNRMQADEQRSVSRHNMLREKSKTDFLRQANKEEHILVRINNNHQQQNYSFALENNKEQIRRNAKIQRIEKFHQKEDQNLRQKHFNSLIANRNKALYQSTIFS